MCPGYRGGQTVSATEAVDVPPLRSYRSVCVRSISDAHAVKLATSVRMEKEDGNEVTDALCEMWRQTVPSLQAYNCSKLQLQTNYIVNMEALMHIRGRLQCTCLRRVLFRS